MHHQTLYSKIKSLEALKVCIQNDQANGLSVVFTNGCFDLLHKGHVDYLSKAADLGDKLIVAVNTDDSVRRLGKSASRPIQDQEARATVIAALESVIYGVPSFVTVPCAASPLSLTDFSQISTPFYPDESLVQQHCASLAYGQFTGEEIANGTAWKLLNK